MSCIEALVYPHSFRPYIVFKNNMCSVDMPPCLEPACSIYGSDFMHCFTQAPDMIT